MLDSWKVHGFNNIICSHEHEWLLIGIIISMGLEEFSGNSKHIINQSRRKESTIGAAH